MWRLPGMQYGFCFELCNAVCMSWGVSVILLGGGGGGGILDWDCGRPLVLTGWWCIVCCCQEYSAPVLRENHAFPMQVFKRIHDRLLSKQLILPEQVICVLVGRPIVSWWGCMTPCSRLFVCVMPVRDV